MFKLLNLWLWLVLLGACAVLAPIYWFFQPVVESMWEHPYIWGSFVLVVFVFSWITVERDRAHNQRYFATEKERLAKLGLSQKMRPLS